MNIKLIILTFLFTFNPLITNACSLYKISKGGKTIVGNNEDWFSPNSQFWFESSQSGKYGVMYMGLLNNFAQGAINEKGLMFDGFYEDYLAINNTQGKTKIPIGLTIKNIMQSMSRVEEVKSYLETVNLSSLTNSMLVFVDNSGSYLIVEGDVIIIGEESEKSFSNFYYSQVESLNDVKLKYFQKGRDFIGSSRSQATLEYCGKAMDHFAQNRITATQYTTVYDLSSLIVRIYLYHDFSQFVEIDLKEELKKGNHKTMIAELFSKESKGYRHYLKYNNPEHPTLFIEEIIGSNAISEDKFNAMGFAAILNPIGYEWLDELHNPKAAIKVFEYGITLMPNNYGLYESLGEAYFADNDWDNSIKSYAKSLVLNPENDNAIEKILESKNKRSEPTVD